MNPYSLDDDPFSAHSLLQHIHERRVQHNRSSLLASCLNSPSRGLGSSSNPYLAYPDLPSRPRTDSTTSYDLIEDDDIPLNCSSSPRSFMSLFPRSPPKKSSAHSRSASADFQSPPNRRSLIPLPPLSPPRPSFSSSTSSLRLFSSTSTTTFDSDSLTDTPSKSRNTFFTSLRSRVSLSSPSKDTLISNTNTPTRALSPGRPYQSHTLPNISDIDNDEDSNIDNFDFLPPPSRRFSRASSQSSASASDPHLPSSSHLHLPSSSTSSHSHLPPSSFVKPRDRVYFSSLTSRTTKKKRKLIITGIGASEFRKLDGVKRWCETFGELRSITRMPNGDLQIDFRDPEVADTVCRVRAKVFIAGVGSVQLSWIIGNNR